MFCRLLAFFIFLSATVSSQTLTVEKIMREPKWMGSSPSGITWLPDSRAVNFLWNPDKALDDSFYTYDLQGRDLGGKDLGGRGPVKLKYMDAIRANATSGAVYNSDFSMRVHIYRGDLYITDIKTGQTRPITQTEEAEFSPKFILNNEWVAYNRSQNLYAWNIRTGTTRQLTNLQRVEPGRGAAARGGRADSVSKQLNQEQWLSRQQLELFDVLEERKKKKDGRNSYLKYNRETDTLKLIDIGEKMLQALDISPSGNYVTYRLFQPAQGKQTIVPDYVTESGFTTDLNTRTKVGAAQGKYEFYLYDKASNREYLVNMDSLPGITDLPDYAKDDTSKARKKPRTVYVASVSWNPSGTRAVLDIRSQDNKDRWLMELEPGNRKLSLVDRQRDEAWIGGPGTGFGARIGWINDNSFYFQSEVTGYSHLYLFDLSTQSKKALTSGKYEVQDLVLSKTKKYFFLLTNEDHPGKQNWYRINIDGSGKSKITSMEGGYEVQMSPDEKWIAYRYSYINKPWELYIQENKAGAAPRKITDKARSEEFSAYPWREAKVITIPASDGAQIYARLYEPETGKKNNAAVIFVHGAGYLQNAHYWWSSYFREYMFHNLLADKGYTVLDIDYRGSAGYGRDWRTGIYRHMGGKDLSDHVDATRYLTSQLGIDASRIGIYGGSYGGFITLMALFTTPDVFKAGAALRPVTDWAHYNHGYTSNILNEPFNDSIAYARSSPINFVSGLENHLLICHGMVDVNVHFQDVVRLSQKLIELGKDNWELAVYPVEDHGFVEPSSWTDEYRRILKLFDTNLLQ
jgi:dipeptidyl aminopeptidase/acylaminoacyl peptidase